MEKLKNLITFMTFIFLWLIIIGLNVFVFGTKGSLTVYGIILSTYLSIKMGLSFFIVPIKEV
ncbi:hyaluronan synthase [Streptococcus uberis]|nr:hyaluronan synthase [Streptococcus uberis]